MANTRETEATLLTFIVGAAFGAGIALLLKKEVRGRIVFEAEDVGRVVKKVLSEAVPGAPYSKPMEVPPTFI